nr:uncharacterized protein LOC126530144 [Dermacentor andersoni]
MAAPSAAGPSTSSLESRGAKRKPRVHFRRHEDLLLLREVVAINPFQNPAMWETLLTNVIAVLRRDVSLRAIKDRVELLVGYFRQDDRENLRKSGTEEQYDELQRLLQEVSDLAREFNYVMKIKPRKRKGVAEVRRQQGPSAAAKATTSAQRMRDAAAETLASQSSHVVDRELNEIESPAAELLCGIYSVESHSPVYECPMPNSPAPPDARPVEDASDDGNIGTPEQQPQRKRQCVPGTARGIRALQELGLELLARREEHEFSVRKEELALAQRRLEYDERKLAFEEEKHRCGQKYVYPFGYPYSSHCVRYEVQRRAEEREQLLERLENLERRVDKENRPSL